MMKNIGLLKQLLAVGLLAVSSLSLAADWAPGSTDWDKLPEVKKSKLALYLTPQQAYDMKKANPKGVAFFDVRTRAEAMYVGWPTDADALIPYVEHPELMTEWDDKRFMYKLEPNQDFVPEVERRLKEMGLGKDATIILVCRSGDRSSKAQDRLQTAGYNKVYGIAEGVEGDTVKDGPKVGQRAVNGWKNANLPWTYKLDKTKMYFPR
jgi:rhodanese-related sulfurtransferase